MDNKDKLSGAIMNIPCARADDTFQNTASRLLYKEGHRDARHAAVDLVNEFAAQAEQMQPPVPRVGGITSIEGLTRYGRPDFPGAEFGIEPDGEYVKLADVAALASQSQAAQPTGLEGENELISMERVKAISCSIRPGDGWGGDEWDFAFANAVAAQIAGTSQATIYDKAYICKGCGGVYVGAPVTRCDCMPAKQEFDDAFVIRADSASQATKAQAEPGEWSDAQREAARDAISITLGDAMDCTRVWEAWRVGTMSQDDFQLLADNDERLDELVSAVEKVVLAAPVAKEAPAKRNPPSVVQNLLHWALKELLGALPERRDWFNPDAEKILRAVAEAGPVASVAKEATREAADLRTFLLNHITSHELEGRSFDRLMLAHNEVYLLREMLDVLPPTRGTVPEASEFASRFRAQGGITITNTESGSDIATTTSTVSAPPERAEPVAIYGGVEFSRYIIEWIGGPLPVGTEFYAAPVAAKE